MNYLFHESDTLTTEPPGRDGLITEMALSPLFAGACLNCLLRCNIQFMSVVLHLHRL